MTEQRQRRAGWSWLAGAAAALGTGIWSMHFIGMLGFELPVPVSYDVPLTLLSLVIAILSVGAAEVEGRDACATYQGNGCSS